MEVAVVGGEEFVLGFRLAGVRKTHAVAAERVEEKITQVIADPDVGILVLSTDDLARLSHGMRRRLESLARPVVITIGKFQQEDLRTKIKRAIGVDLLK